MVANEHWFGTAGGFEIDYSCRFTRGDSAYMHQTPGGANTGDRLSTISVWVKRAGIGTQQAIINQRRSSDTCDAVLLYFMTNDTLKLQMENKPSGTCAMFCERATNQVFTDVGSWYHIVVAWDSNQTDDTCASMYINGEEITDFATKTNFSSATDIEWLHTSNAIAIGRSQNAANYCDLYMANMAVIDGAKLTAASFGETNSITGQWVPKNITGLTYGNEGFLLAFQDSSALGDDTSGNGNDFTTVNLAAADQVIDTPTDNFCTWNPQHREPPDSNTIVLSDGNLNMAQGSQTNQNILSTHRLHGKQYVEIKLLGSSNSSGTRQSIGVVIDNIVLANGESPYTGNTFAGVQFPLLTDYSDGSAQRFFEDGTPVTLANNETLCFAISEDDGKFWTRVNGGSWHNGDPEDTSTTGTGTFSNIPTGRGLWINHAYDTSDNNTVDFGQLGYAYTPPDGYKPVSTKNIPAPKITTPAHYFQTTLFTGTGSSLAVDQDGARTFEPDFVWIKNRDAADDHCLFDSARGATKLLISNDSDAETTDADTLTSFDSDGFTVGGDVKVNTSTEKYVAHQWLESATAGFDIVEYTGNATNRTISHSLGAVPELMIVRRTNAVENWGVYHGANTTAPATDSLILDLTNATNDAATVWNDTAPTSSVFSVGTGGMTNSDGNPYIAYLFAGVDGYSKFGKYTGNGDNDGPFAWTGFRPSLIIVKKSSATGGWYMINNQSYPVNRAPTKSLMADSNVVEADDNGGGSGSHHLFSNGFKLTDSGGGYNGDGATYVYMAFAETPFKTANAR